MRRAFLQQAEEIVEANLSNSHFTVAIFAEKIGMSRQHLNRKLRQLTGCTVQQFIRNRRLRRAAQLLQQQAGSVTQIAYEVGFRNPAYFSKCFAALFCKSPRAYMLDHQSSWLGQQHKDVP